MQAAAIVLAAGAGTRMKSDLPKVAHEMLGKPLVNWVLDAVEQAGVNKAIVVVGHKRQLVEPLVAHRAEIVVQTKLLGTADAVASCAQALDGFDGSVLVLSGDSPLVNPQTLRKLIALREEADASVVVLTMRPQDPFGYGRIIRDADGSVARIVEQKDATPEEAAVGECNSGMYCFDAKSLFGALESVNADNAQGEFYLTDVLEICRNAGRRVLAYEAEDSSECLGVNTLEQLAEVSELARRRVLQ